MDFFKAIEWVQNNEPTIRSKIWQYRKFTPYEVSDFLQEAYEAALVASLLSQERDIPFEAAFWTTFRNRISVLTPDPNFTHGSNSIPSHLCSEDIDSVELISSDNNEGIDVEAIFEAVAHHLTERERQTLSLSLGVTERGQLSSHEIAALFGCSDFCVRDTLKRAYRRIKKLTENGTIVIDRMRLVALQCQEAVPCSISFSESPLLQFAARSPPS